MDQPKQYEATVKLGATTATLDPESAEEPTMAPAGAPPPDLGAVQAILPRFVGTIEQVPPVFSAMKVGGRRAYDLARKGHDVQLEPRPVRVYGIELLGYQWPFLHLRIDCGRGTYVRALARDIGQALGVGGYLTGLRRTRVGSYYAKQGVSVEQLQADGVETHFHPTPDPAPAPPAQPG